MSEYFFHFAVLAVAIGVNIGVSICTYRKLTARDEERRGDEAAQAAMDAAAERELERRERENSAAIDEGFANIMGYAVNGKTGCERD